MNDLQLAEALAREAGALLLDAFGSVLRTASKSTPTDLVSEADLASERLLRTRLAAERPDDGIVGEEGDDVTGSSGRRWVVDPLDGTVNFLYGIPQWCVSVAVEDDAGALAGVVYDPVRDEAWGAERGGTARCNGEVVEGSRCDSLAAALIATGFGYDAEVRRRQVAVLTGVLPLVRDIRRAGAAALDLAWLAGGRYDGYYERGVQRWDVAAGRLLCECAGLTVIELAPDPPAAAGLLAAPGPIAGALAGLVVPGSSG